jgi:hypothetical protein
MVFNIFVHTKPVIFGSDTSSGAARAGVAVALVKEFEAHAL